MYRKVNLSKIFKKSNNMYTGNHQERRTMENKYFSPKALLLTALLFGVAPLTADQPSAQIVQGQPNDSKLISTPDGTSIEIKQDGTKVIKEPDGTIVEVRADGSKKITKSNGTTIDERSDGSKLVTNPDGSTIEVKPKPKG